MEEQQQCMADGDAALDRRMSREWRERWQSGIYKMNEMVNKVPKTIKVWYLFFYVNNTNDKKRELKGQAGWKWRRRRDDND